MRMSGEICSLISPSHVRTLSGVFFRVLSFVSAVLPAHNPPYGSIPLYLMNFVTRNLFFSYLPFWKKAS